MENNSKLYFIAVIPPKEVSDRVQEIKYFFRDTYNAVAPLKSPAHITLQPPFSILETNESDYVERLAGFKFDKGKFEVTLKNFAAFAPRTIYIDVVTNGSLLELQKDLSYFLIEKSLITSDQVDRRPYKAHVTVANKDLKRHDFKTAWESFKPKSFEAGFEVSSFSLLKHNGRGWDIFETFIF